MATDKPRLSDEEIIQIAKSVISGVGSEDQDIEWSVLLREEAPGLMDLLFWDARPLTPEAALAEVGARPVKLLGPRKSEKDRDA